MEWMVASFVECSTDFNEVVYTLKYGLKALLVPTTELAHRGGFGASFKVGGFWHLQ